jgi:hypothetical protein
MTFTTIIAWLFFVLAPVHFALSCIHASSHPLLQLRGGYVAFMLTGWVFSGWWIFG